MEVEKVDNCLPLSQFHYGSEKRQTIVYLYLSFIMEVKKGRQLSTFLSVSLWKWKKADNCLPLSQFHYGSEKR